MSIHRVSSCTARLACLAGVLSSVILLPSTGRAQSSSGGDTARVLGTVTVTATRTEKDVLRTPVSVSVLDSADIRQAAPNTVADLFRHLPGLDVTGVGTSQTRPTIRGQRGQRILLLEDGIRIGNSRRQQDFGELPAIVDVTGIDRVEVVRGPASVLYGTDAIGGVVNLISDGVPPRGFDGVGGSLGYRFGSADAQQRPSGEVHMRSGRFAARARVAWRDTDPYDAPAGRFGDVTLDDDTRVHDTGVRDQTQSFTAGWDLTNRQRLSAKFERYAARDAGFGYVDDAALGGDGTRIRILYPEQDVHRFSVGYAASGLGAALADRVETRAYFFDNDRIFDQDIFVPLGPPGASVAVQTHNVTDLRTTGLRAEATKLLGRVLLTYGIDAFRERSENTDSSATTVSGFGPPQTSTETRPNVPNATFRSAGIFAQGDVSLGERLTMILGARYQDVRAASRPTEGHDSTISSTDRTVVGAANVLVNVADGVNLVGSVGRGFRSPNLVERFFDGPTPEGSGYQQPNASLEPETSVNVEGGVKLRRGIVGLEAFVFRNTISDGVRVEATGDSVGPFPAFRNVNVDRLRFSGVELSADLSLPYGWLLGGSWTRLETKDVNRPDAPVGDTYSSKVTGELGYRSPAGRVWGGYLVRHNGEQKDIVIGTSPVGDVLPAFTVHTVRGGVRLFERGGVTSSLAVSVENLTNELYAEFANASFFRPEAERSVTVSWLLGF
jgi:outer membrane receptor protein involved in Fe transport